MNQNAINVFQGQPFTITLRSNGGTNYAWVLVSMPEGVVLAAVDSAPVSSNPGGLVDRTFTFFATQYKSAEKVEIVFNLIEWSDPEKVADTVTFDAVIIPHNEKQGLKGFVRYSENAAAYNIPPYGANGSFAGIVKYGYPQCVKYGFYGCEEPAASSVAFKYGYPGCDSMSNAVKYGYQGCAPYVIEKYGYQGCDASIIVKYGYQDCDASVSVKYGYVGCEPSASVLYGYYGCK